MRGGRIKTGALRGPPLRAAREVLEVKAETEKDIKETDEQKGAAASLLLFLKSTNPELRILRKRQATLNPKP